MAQEKVEFYKCDEVTNASTVSDNGIIVNVNGGIYIGNETNEPILIANKVEKVSDIENDLNYLNEEAVKTINGTSLVGQGDIKLVNSILSLTYSELVTLRDSSQLMPGQQYRITDYVTTTRQVNTQSAGHQFDIIVTADDESTLNEVARAIQHNEDTYFANSDLNSWQIWYCLDNDTDRFKWADTTNGKGVIYRMIDEFDNDCPYDFKNIMFLRGLYEEGWLIPYHEPNGDEDLTAYCYTFGWFNEDGTMLDVTIFGNNGTLIDEEGQIYGVHGNIIKEKFNYDNPTNIQQRLNNIVFLSTYYWDTGIFYGYCDNSFGDECYNNSFGNNCYNNSFGNSCYNNSFGDDYYNNSFGDECYNNSFGNNCYNNSFGHNCKYNSFGDSCFNNSFGNSCSSNSFGDSCYNNSFGNSCYNNSFGDDCRSNSFGNDCNINSFGKYCINNSFGNSCSNSSFGNYCINNSFGNNCTYNSFRNSASKTSTLKDYCEYNHFDDGCSYNVIWNSDTTSTSIKLKNVNVNRGVCGTSGSYNFINIETLNSEKEININNYNRHIYIDYGDIIKVTYNELVDLRDNSQLIPGRQYKIIDYVTTTSQVNTQSAGHQFDIIVTALDENTLSEEAQAAIGNDGYFDESDLNSWQIWYCLDNDTDRFAWVDTTNGKGVIYRMIDEWNNDCPYDFKNIQFRHPNDIPTYPDYYYTFSTVIDGSVTDHSMVQGRCYGNIMKESITSLKQILNNNVFLNTSKTSNCFFNSFEIGSENNSFGNGCYSNSFGESCHSNSFGNGCYSNSFGNNCYSNSFGESCYNNSFGNICYSNSFVVSCTNNSFGNRCYYNSFGNRCYYNSFGNDCNNNSFGNICYYNLFGVSCNNNSFGNDCNNNSFGNDCNNNSFRVAPNISSPLKNYVQHNHFDDGCSYNVIWNSNTTSSSILLKNININRGLVGTRRAYNLINIETLNSEKEINVDNINGYIYVFEGPEKTYKTTYNNLVSLRNNLQLIPGTWYRITDYVTTTVQENTQSAGHQFDVLVLATSKSTLSEEAKAMLHEGDTYFSGAGANLDAWKLWYCLDNDTDRFAWADSTNGKGVIYRMIDEWNNDCPYDFKNILYAVYKIINIPIIPGYNLYQVSNTLINNLNYTISSTPLYAYTFCYSDDDVNVTDATVNQLSHSIYTTKNSNNVIRKHEYGLHALNSGNALPANVFITNSSGFFTNNDVDGYQNVFCQRSGLNIIKCMYGSVFFGSGITVEGYASSMNRENIIIGNDNIINKVSRCVLSGGGNSYVDLNKVILHNTCSGSNLSHMSNVDIFCEDSASIIYNYDIHSINGLARSITIPQGGEYLTKVTMNSSGDIKVYCEADLIA